MPILPSYTAFGGEHLLASGAAWEVAIAARKVLQGDGSATVLIFEDHTGRQVDFDLRGTDEEIASRLNSAAEPAETAESPRSVGRPRLGVVAREVTLLPRHWDWLNRQPGGASATLRRLVETARKRAREGHVGIARDAQQAADRFMMTMLGDQPGYEEAARALYSGDQSRFLSFSEPWPANLRDYARQLAGPAFDQESASEGGGR